MLRYVELKSGFAHDGPAWIAHVRTSKSGRTVYFRGMTLIRAQVNRGNHIDRATGDVYWVSGVKIHGSNRWGGVSAEVPVERRAVEAYGSLTGCQVPERMVVDIPNTDPQAFVDRFNEVLSLEAYQNQVR